MLNPKLVHQLLDKPVQLPFEVLLQTFCADCFVVLLPEPLDYRVFYFADAAEVGEVFAEFVTVWG